MLMMFPFVLVALQPDLNIGLIIPGIFALFLWNVMAPQFWAVLGALRQTDDRTS